jgi:NAD(P)-dependent dehydrogenase (short-subunit alcohol dehydrogenase family)
MAGYTDLTDRKALVVGGGLGIGRAIVEILAESGANVAVLDREADRAENVSASVTKAGRKSLAIVEDVTKQGAAERGVAAAASAFGGLDLLVNVVGFAARSPLAEMSDELFDLDLSRNLRYFFRFGREFAKLPRPEGPRAIVNIASIGGVQAAPGIGAYGASKAGLIALTKTEAVEWGSLGIRVNAIAPGSIITDRYQGAPELNERRAKAIPLGRLGQQTEIAKAVLFLASDLASYVTGHTLIVDGGITCRSANPGPQGGEDRASWEADHAKLPG